MSFVSWLSKISFFQTSSSVFSNVNLLSCHSIHLFFPNVNMFYHPEKHVISRSTLIYNKRIPFFLHTLRKYDILDTERGKLEKRLTSNIKSNLCKISRHYSL